MKARWFGVAVVALIAILFGAIAKAQDEGFPFDQKARVERIEFELRQIQAEQERLVDERRELIRERGCVSRAKHRGAMKACATRRA